MPATALDERTALVLIDLQKGITAGDRFPHASADVVARSARLAAAFRERNLPVVLVRVAFAADFGDVPPGRTEQPAAGGPFPADFAELVPELDRQPSDLVVTKHQWGAFHGTELDLQLRRRGVTQIVLAGIATSIGVESTARAAHEHGYSVTVAEDACADGEAEAHAHSVARIFPRLGEVGSTDAILGLLK